jgi:hypothetical protein
MILKVGLKNFLCIKFLSPQLPDHILQQLKASEPFS